MKKLFFLSLLFTLVIFKVSAQDDDSPVKPPTTNAQNVYGELGGNGLLFSVNYDFRFAKSQKGLGMRVGAGFLGGSDGGVVTIPIGLNYLTGRAPNYLELGLGFTYASLTSGDDFFDEASTTFLIPSIGYRYQPKGKGFTGRVALTPLIFLAGGGWVTWGGVSAGYKF